MTHRTMYDLGHLFGLRDSTVHQLQLNLKADALEDLLCKLNDVADDMEDAKKVWTPTSEEEKEPVPIKEETNPGGLGCSWGKKPYQYMLEPGPSYALAPFWENFLTMAERVENLFNRVKLLEDLKKDN